MQLNLAHFEPCSYIYGPGARFVIWTQGCSLHCKGCWNTETWAFKPKHLLRQEQVFELIQEACLEHKLEGLTILGGEPFDQYEACLALAKQIREQTKLSLILYSGYELSELEGKRQTAIFEYTDVLISGRYKEEQRSTEKMLIGSTNQQFHFFSNRYTSDVIEDGQYMEIHLYEDGSSQTLGYPDKEICLG